MCPHYHEDSLGLGREGVKIQVFPEDAVTVAERLFRAFQTPSGSNVRKDPILVLCSGHRFIPGDGWKDGKLGSEEELAYRTSISLTYDEEGQKGHGLPAEGGTYAHKVVLIREPYTKGHAYYDFARVDKLPTISVVTIGAKRLSLTMDGQVQHVYNDKKDSEACMAKWRFFLRLAGNKGHRRLVLTLIGADKHGHPPQDVLKCFAKVMMEPEFRKGWFEQVCFAIPPYTGGKSPFSKKMYQGVHGNLNGVFFG